MKWYVDRLCDCGRYQDRTGLVSISREDSTETLSPEKASQVSLSKLRTGVAYAHGHSGKNRKVQRDMQHLENAALCETLRNEAV